MNLHGTIGIIAFSPHVSATMVFGPTNGPFFTSKFLDGQPTLGPTARKLLLRSNKKKRVERESPSGFAIKNNNGNSVMRDGMMRKLIYNYRQ